MPKFEVDVSWEGYSRGKSRYVIKVEDEDEARELYMMGKLLSKDTIRSDIEHEVESIKDITSSNK